jgi:hypothetical protein
VTIRILSTVPVYPLHRDPPGHRPGDFPKKDLQIDTASGALGEVLADAETARRTMA